MILLLQLLELATLTGMIGLQVTPPTTRTPTCASGDCHLEQTSYTFLHGPTAADFCRGCHAYLDESKHTFELKSKGAEQCNFCHMGKTNLGGLIVHEPVVKEKCRGCHDPHGSNRRYLLSEFNNREMCAACHGDLLEGRSKLHNPSDQGDCLDCHRAHSSMHENLLIDDWGQMCRECHQPLFATIAGAVLANTPSEADSPLKKLDPPLLHEPVADDCGVCHDPHGSNHDFLLTDSPFQLCATCHEEVSEIAENSVMSHSIVYEERACLNCHAPHVSQSGSLLRDRPIIVCLECHSDDIAIDDETILSPPPTISFNPIWKRFFTAPCPRGNARDVISPMEHRIAGSLPEPSLRILRRSILKTPTNSAFPVTIRIW